VFFLDLQASFLLFFSTFKVLVFLKIKYSKISVFTVVLSLVCCLNTSAQIGAYLGFATFNTPNNQPFLETYITFLGSSYQQNKNNNGFYSSVNIQLKIYKDTLLVKALKYNLNGPNHPDSSKSPSFIDTQRFSLANGKYLLEIEIEDNFKPLAKKESIKSSIDINFHSDLLELSDIQLVESYKKTEKQSILSKSGLDLIPYSINYFPEPLSDLKFYLEAYNTDKILGINKNFIFYYYLETDDGKLQLNGFGSFKKQATSKINPMIGKINLNNLGTGYYNLVVEIKDELNIIKAKKKILIQRVNSNMEITNIQKKSSQQEIQNYFGACNNADTLKMFVECLWPIADGADKDRIINQAIKKDKELMKKYIIDFWTRRAADTANPIKLWANYYKNVQVVMANFRCGKMPGYYTDRGRAYLQYGAPNQRARQPNEPNTFPYEIWQYYRITDGTNGQSFSNRRFVFVSKNLGDDCYVLVHSDMRGELNNPRWQFEVTRRNSNGIANPDNNTPNGTETNQFNEIYNNPR
jgi:GWxTD domain-containing protein